MRLRLRAAVACVALLGVEWAAHGRASIGLVLLVAAWGLLRRRPDALPLASALVAASAVGAVLWRDAPTGILAAGTGALLVVARHEVTGEPDSSRRLMAARLAIGVAGLSLVAGVGLVAAFPSKWEPSGTPRLALRETVDRLAGGSGPLAPSTSPSRLLERSLPALFAAGELAAVIVLVLPAPAEPPVAGDRRDVLDLIDRSGRDSLAPFAARTDKSYVFAPNGRAAVGYRTVVGVALAGGDPVGEPACQADAFATYLGLCEARGWTPAVVGAGRRTAAIARRHGMHALHIGDEAVVDVASFVLDVPAMRNARQAVQRSRNFGVTVEVAYEHDLPPALRAELMHVAERGHKGPPGRGFSMILDGFLAGIYPGTLIVFCRDRDGTPVALQRYLPYAGAQGLSLDTMCRVPGSPNGVNERMIVQAITWAKAHGVSEVSLNFAAFRELYDRRLGPLERIEYWLVHRLDPLVRIESIYRFNAKFRPQWRPRYVLFRSLADVATILPAALIAEFATPAQIPGVGPEQPISVPATFGAHRARRIR